MNQNGIVLGVPLQGRRNNETTKLLLRKLLTYQGWTPRVMITNKSANDGARD